MDGTCLSFLGLCCRDTFQDNIALVELGAVFGVIPDLQRKAHGCRLPEPERRTGIRAGRRSEARQAVWNTAWILPPLLKLSTNSKILCKNSIAQVSQSVKSVL